MNALPKTRDWELFMIHSAPYKLHDPWFDTSERATKLELARVGRALLDAAAGDLPLQGPLEDLLGLLETEEPPYDLVPATVAAWVRSWLSFDEASLRRALGSFLRSEESPDGRFATFVEAAEDARSAGLAVDARDVMAFGSLLNFAVAPETCPVVGANDFSREIERLTGFAADASVTLSEQYAAHLSVARLVEAEMKAADIGVRDMVDVQGLVGIASLQVLPYQRWEAFLKHAAYVRGNPRFEPEERDRMLEVARRGQAVLQAARGDAPLTAVLDSFLGLVFDPERLYDLVWDDVEHATRGWASSDEDQFRRALRCFLEKEEPTARFAAFATAATEPQPAEIATDPAMLMTLGSLFNFVVDPESAPVVGHGRFSYQASRLRDFSLDHSASLAEQYAQRLEFANRIEAEMKEEPIGVRDMLDVQILVCLSSLWFSRSTQDALWRIDAPAVPTRPTGSEDRARADRPPMPYLAVCACLGYDAPYLREWIEFHRLVGVERFFLYNNGDRETQRELLAPYVEEGVVVLHDWTVFPPQTPAYNHLLEEHREGARWVAVIDTDEFLFASTGQPLPEVLADYEAWPGVGVSRLTFGTSGHRTRPDGLVTENYLGSFDARVHRHIKTIIDPVRTAECLGPHHFRYEDGSLAVDENHYPILGATTAFTSFSRLRINHYYTRSEAEFRRKLSRLRPDNAAPYPESMWRQFTETFRDRYGRSDETILRYVPALKERLAATASPAIRSGA